MAPRLPPVGGCCSCTAVVNNAGPKLPNDCTAVTMAEQPQQPLAGTTWTPPSTILSYHPNTLLTVITLAVRRSMWRQELKQATVGVVACLKHGCARRGRRHPPAAPRTEACGGCHPAAWCCARGVTAQQHGVLAEGPD
jgi:hypothetical protein